MNKRHLLGTLTLLLAVLFAGCEREQLGQLGSGTGEGRLNVTLSTSGEVSGVVTRASESIPELEAFGTEENLAKFKLAIYQEGTLKDEWAYGTNNDVAFLVGNYNVIASYGDASKEGFDLPAFKASQDFIITDGETTDVNLVAKLANARISVAYTEEFTTYFSDYNVTINDIAFEKTETRAAYFQPGVVSIYANVMKQEATEMVQLKIKDLTVQACSEYRLTLDVDNGGTAMLTVTFDGNVEDAEPVSIPVSDADLNAAPPTLTPVNYTHDAAVSVVEGMKPSVTPIRAVLNTSCGISSCILTTNSKTLTNLGWPAEVDLANSASNLTVAKNLGLEIKGFDSNSEGMAIVDFTNVIENLAYDVENPNNTFTLVATDTRSRETEALTLKVIPSSNLFAVQAPSSIAYGTQTATMTVTLNGNIEDVTYTHVAYGSPQAIVPTSVETAADGITHTVTFVFPSMQTNTTDGIIMTASYKTKTIDINIALDSPTLTASYSTGDIWATTADITAEDAAVYKRSNAVTDGVELQIKNGTVWEKATYTVTDPVFTMSHLSPSTKQTIRLVRKENDIAIAASVEYSFTTESALQVPNANMNDWNVEEQAKLSGTTWSAYIPNSGSWATTNAKTFRSPHGAMDYVCNAFPSVTKVSRSGSDAAAAIQSIGFAAYGTSVSITTNTNSICYNRSAGRLFLGSYSFTYKNCTETYTYGIPFTSRPLQVKFDSKYTAYNNDNYKVWAVVENRTDNAVTRLAYGEIAAGSASSDYQSTTMELTYEENNKHLKATHFYIVFASSNKCNDAFDTENTAMKSYVHYDDNEAWTGSTLYIDNIELIY